MKLTWTNLSLLLKKGMTVKNLKMSYLSKFLSINVIFDHEFHMKYIAGKNFNYNCLKMYFNLVVLNNLYSGLEYFIELRHIILMYLFWHSNFLYLFA